MKLAKERHGVLISGTIKSDRPGLPWNYLCDWNQNVSDRGYYRWGYNEHCGMYATVWKDRNVVPMLSSGFGVEHDIINRGGGGGKQRGKLRPTQVAYGRYNYRCPKMIKQFNKHMRGLDIMACGTKQTPQHSFAGILLIQREIPMPSG